MGGGGPEGLMMPSHRQQGDLYHISTVLDDSIDGFGQEDNKQDHPILFDNNDSVVNLINSGIVSNEGEGQFPLRNSILLILTKQDISFSPQNPLWKLNLIEQFGYCCNCVIQKISGPQANSPSEQFLLQY
ncbi:MAG: hypothetical protein ACPLX7_10140 [Candidatus Kapaibacteriota bacterium]